MNLLVHVHGIVTIGRHFGKIFLIHDRIFNYVQIIYKEFIASNELILGLCMPLTKLTKRYFAEMKNQKRKFKENLLEESKVSSKKTSENVSSGTTKFKFRRTQEPSEVIEEPGKIKTLC